MPVPPASLFSASGAVPEALLRDVLAVALTSIYLLRPLPGPTGELADFALAYLNPVAQRLTGLPEQPGSRASAQLPGIFTEGCLAICRRVFESGQAQEFAVVYQGAVCDGYGKAAARRSGDWLVVSVADAADQPQEALREHYARHQATSTKAQSRQAELEALFEQVPLALALFSGPQHVVTLANARMTEIWSRPLEGVLGRPHVEALPDLVEQGFEKVLDDVFQTGQPYALQEQLVTIAQAQPPYQGYFNITYHPAYDGLGQICGVIAAAVEVSDLVRARQKMQTLNDGLEARVAVGTQQVQAARADADAQRADLQQLFRLVPAAICILSGPDLVFEYFNPSYQQLVPGRALQGQPIFDALPELAGTPVNTLLRQVYETGEACEGQELRIQVARATDGELEDRYFSFAYHPRRDEQQRVNGVISFVFDVTGQVRARQAVEASAQQLRLVTDALPVLISYLDAEHIYRFANRAYEAWFHYPAAQMVGLHPRQVVGEAAYQQVRGYMERVLMGEQVEYEARMEYAAGLVKYTHGTFVPDVQAGRVVGFYALIVDVTAQVEARLAIEASAQQALALASELHTANEQLVRTNVDLDTFIYTASHDLKAPISNIESLLLLLRKQLPAEARQAGLVPKVLGMMQASIERFQLTIAQLTDLAKLQHIHTQLAEQVDLSALVEAVCLDLSPQLDEAQAQLLLDLEPDVHVSFAPRHLRSIIYNLLSNAIKYRYPGRPPVVQLRCYRTATANVVEVQDNGLGLTTAQQSKLFGMFRRLHDHVPGTGVGLYMVKRIVENAGGSIRVQSEEGVGSTFTVTLPAQAAD